ncbi:3-keto-5-aminohexanoate cleavage protein [Candidatus Uhrbacteria bacterium]|nr:3-keto-5-aminohexanoate cleavage protein [Candidatus Uhrbacteria bacterium]
MKTIISCAITGAIHTPSLSPYLPVTPDEIAEQSIDAAKAGASIIHLHARQPNDGKPTNDTKIFREFLTKINSESDAILNISTGVALGMTLDERLAAVKEFQPELCSLNMGSINFNVARAAKADVKWKHDWEKEHLAKSEDIVFRNTFKDIDYIIKTVSDFGTKFEYECYDVGHLYNLAHFAEHGIIKPPFFIQFIFGVMGGIGADEQAFNVMKQTADKLFGNNYHFSVLGAGRHQFLIAELSLKAGGNVRVGLEDNLYLDKGVLARSNAEQVAKVKQIALDLGREIANPDETRQILDLKGKDKTKITLS